MRLGAGRRQGVPYVVHDLQGRLGVQLLGDGLPVHLGLHGGGVHALRHAQARGERPSMATHLLFPGGRPAASTRAYFSLR